MGKGIDTGRRSFLKKASAATAAAATVPTLVSLNPKTAAAAPSTLNKWPGRCVVNFNDGASSGSSAVESVCKKMVDDSIKLLTGEDTVGAAWKAVFPDTLSTSSKIAIKINILNSSVPPHPFVVMGITEGLLQMDIGGSSLPAGNITIYDSNNSSTMDSAGFTAARFPGINRVKDSRTATGGARDKNYASVLGAADFLINIPGMRGHWGSYGSVTLGFKSHFGTYDVNSHQDNHAYLRDINCTGPVHDKLVMTVCGAIFALNIGHGPGGSADNYSTWARHIDPDSTTNSANTVILSSDLCTAEYQIIKAMRINAGQSYTQDSMPDYLKASSGVAGSLSTVLNVGVSDESAMEYCEIVNEEITAGGTTVADRTPAAPAIGRIEVGPNPAVTFAGIGITVPDYHEGSRAGITINDMAGRNVRTLSAEVMGARSRVNWDLRDENGRRVKPGNYICRLSLGSISTSRQFTVR